MSMNRRQFIQGTAAAAAALGVSGSLAHAEEAAPSAPRWSFEIPPEPITDIAATYEADVIVVGAGVSGLVTATTACEEGLNVILVAASSKPVSRGGSNNAVWSKAMERAGLPRWDAGKELRKELAFNSFLPDERKYAKYAKCSEEAMNWLIDIMEEAGYETSFEPGSPYPEDSIFYSAQASHAWISEENTHVGQTQAFVAQTMYEKLLSVGGTVYFNTIAKQLEKDDSGRVVAVICQMDDGSFAKFVGPKAIVLATGDFSADREMMERYCPRMIPFLNQASLDGDPDYEREFSFGGIYKGDGQKMGLWAGAAWQHDDNNAPMLISAGEAPCRPYCAFWGLKVNMRGERFCNEDQHGSFAASAVYKQPGAIAYCIWDDAYADGESWYAMNTPLGGAPLTSEEIHASFHNGFDTLEEALEANGLPVEETMATIERYNELCDAGVDEDFFKESYLMKPIRTAPFYCVPESIMFLTVMGGLRTDDKLRVCDANDDPIPGLYNVGIMVGDMYSNIYTFMVFGFNYGCCCLTFGHETGKFIAANEPIEYVPRQGPAQRAAIYTAGTYTASAPGYGGDVTVTMIVSDDMISNVTIDGPGEEQGIKAINEMPSEFILYNTANVDGVAGATVTSDAIKAAAADCIAQAKA